MAFYRRWLQPFSSTRRPIRLRQYRHKAVWAAYQTIEVPRREIRGASKGQSQRDWHRSGAAFLLFYQLAAYALTFERSQIINEELAFKMIYFML